MINKLLVSILVTLCGAGAVAQTSTDAVEASASKTSAPVAYVYVTRPTHLDAFAASSSGKLTAVPGSPYSNIALSHLSVTKKYLFGAGDNSKDLYTYSIGSNGAIKQVSEIDAASYIKGERGGFGPTALDATGTTLYNLVNYKCEGEVQSFKIESNGDLGYLGTADNGLPSDIATLGELRVEGANKFAYQVGFGGDEGFTDPFIARYKRGNSGLLSEDGLVSGLPKTKSADDDYVPFAVASDSSDHLAMAIRDFDNDSEEETGTVKLATFTVASDGSLSTKSTYENMASTSFDYVNTMSISPASKFLAVAGDGFQVFHFDGGSQVTKLSGVLLSGKAVEQFGWDKDDHLYVLTTNSLYVYDVTSSSVKEASGSPYSIPEASSLIVLSE